MHKSAAKLLRAAKQASVTGNGAFAAGLSPHGETIDVLRNKKGMTWQEVATWLHENGVPRLYSVSAVGAAHRKYLADLSDKK